MKSPTQEVQQRAQYLYLSERDLAAVSGLAVRTLQGWRLRGFGPPWRRLGSAIRYSLAEFHQWAASQPGGGERSVSQ